ncbi:MAG: ubiquinone biosynthesis protein UbiB, partial [Sphingorhabdus sp.]
KQADTLKLIPDLIRRLDEQLPRKGGAPEAPPLPQVRLIWDRSERRTASWWSYAVIAAVSGATGALAMAMLG